jgi:hypothetical protein
MFQKNKVDKNKNTIISRSVKLQKVFSSLPDYNQKKFDKTLFLNQKKKEYVQKNEKSENNENTKSERLIKKKMDILDFDFVQNNLEISKEENQDINKPSSFTLISNKNKKPLPLSTQQILHSTSESISTPSSSALQVSSIPCSVPSTPISILSSEKKTKFLPNNNSFSNFVYPQSPFSFFSQLKRCPLLEVLHLSSFYHWNLDNNLNFNEDSNDYSFNISQIPFGKNMGDDLFLSSKATNSSNIFSFPKFTNLKELIIHDCPYVKRLLCFLFYVVLY